MMIVVGVYVREGGREQVEGVHSTHANENHICRTMRWKLRNKRKGGMMKTMSTYKRRMRTIAKVKLRKQKYIKKGEKDDPEYILTRGKSRKRRHKRLQEGVEWGTGDREKRLTATRALSVTTCHSRSILSSPPLPSLS